MADLSRSATRIGHKDYCYDIEMSRALERHKAHEGWVIPVILSACAWHEASFGKLQALPTDGKPVRSWPDRDSAWRNVAQALEKAFREVLEDRERRRNRRDAVAEAAKAVAGARKALAELDYRKSHELLLHAMALDPRREEELKAEFGFLLNSPVVTGPQTAAAAAIEAGLRWQCRVWRILCERNGFVPPMCEQTPEKPEGPAPTGLEESSRVQASIPRVGETGGGDPGEELERAVLRLFRTFFRFGEGIEEDLLAKLRQQRRGTQFGHDVSLEAILQWNQNVRCHVECKNLSDPITLKDVADKLIAQEHFDSGIDLWILISPRADPSNELDLLLESWRQEGRFPFDVRVWSPETGVDEFFGLEPAVYDQFFQPTDEASHPRDWDEAKRTAVYERWRGNLQPPLRLPKGWGKYLRQPEFQCIHRENARAMDSVFANHVTLHCRNEAGATMPEPLEHYVSQWLDQPDKPSLFLLGDFGDGKTFFTYVLTRGLARGFLEDPKSGWIPLRLSLRDFWASGTSRDFLRRRLEEFGAEVEGWTKLKADHRLLVILDGFDEMSAQLDPASVTRNIAALLRWYEESDGCKVMITSRRHFFERRQDVRRLMSRLGNPPVYLLAPISRRATVSHLEAVAQERGLQQALRKLHTLHDPIGLAREWRLTHPRRSEWRLVASGMPQDEPAVGILPSRQVWLRTSSEFAFYEFDLAGEMRPLARFPLRSACRMVELSPGTDIRSVDLKVGPVTCLAARAVDAHRHLLACGQDDGTVRVWFVDLRERSWRAQCVLEHRLHEGPVTAVAFLDDSRIASGGADRTIVVTQVDTRGGGTHALRECRLQLAFRCKGMRIRGLKGPEEQGNYPN